MQNYTHTPGLRKNSTSLSWRVPGRMATWEFLTRCRICFAIGIKCSVNFGFPFICPVEISVWKSNYQKLNRNVQQKTHVSRCTWDFGAFVCPFAFLISRVPRLLYPVSNLLSAFAFWTCHCFEQQELATVPGIDIDIVWQRKSKTYQIKVCTFPSFPRLFLFFFFCPLNTCSPPPAPRG